MSSEVPEEKATLLLVDDTPANIDILRAALQDHFRLKVATNGIQALQVLDKTGAPDLILLDIMMPEMDGFDTCRHIKNDDRFSMVPVIFLTARTEEADLLKAFELGGADYVTKPFRVPELMARIHTHLEIQSNRKKLVGRNRDYQEMLHILCHDLANPLSNVQSVLSLIEDDPEGFEDFLPDMSRTVAQGLEIIEQVREARSLDEKGLKIETVDLSEAILASRTTLKYRFSDKGVALVIPENVPPILIKAEKVSLVNSVLNNLLTNAVKFTPAGKMVTVSTKIVDDRVLLTITDEGIGMPDDIITELFNPLSRKSHREGTDGEAGTGFGMPLVMTFMTAYGGLIEVQSEVGSGTELVLEFMPAEIE
jgi:two-component system sensor histidine kinase/response regulator